MTRRGNTDFTHPDYPHGTNSGYNNGCRKLQQADCPASPDCVEAHNAELREYRARRKAIPRGTKPGVGRQVEQVLKRYHQTLEVVTRRELADWLGVASLNTLDNWSRSNVLRGTRSESRGSAELDRAWAWFVHGIDLTKVTKHNANTYEKYYCRCTVCAQAMVAGQRRLAAGVKSPTSKYVHEPRAHKHLTRLLGAAGSVRQLAPILDIAPSTIHLQLSDPDRPYQLPVLQKIMSATVQSVKAAATNHRLVPSDPTVCLVGQLNALGYSNAWIARNANVGTSFRYVKGRVIYTRVAESIRKLHASVGDKFATPGDGFTKESIRRAKNQAARNGYYPPAAYNDDGTLGSVAPVDVAHAHNEDRLGLHLKIANMAVLGMSQDTIADLLKIERKNVQRVTKKLGLQYRHDQSLDPLASAAVIRRVKDQWAAYEIDMVGAVTACLDLGLADFNRRLMLHPEAIAWDKARKEKALDDVAC